MNGARYQQMLNDHLLNFMALHECTTFMQDSIPCHKSKQVMKWLQNKKIHLLDWPGNSPDQNLWTIMKMRLSEKNPQNFEELKTAILSVWCQEIDTDLCRQMVDSMPKRISQVIENKGFHSKY